MIGPINGHAVVRGVEVHADTARPLLSSCDLVLTTRTDPDHTSYSSPLSASQRTLHHPCSGTDVARPDPSECRSAHAMIAWNAGPAVDVSLRRGRRLSFQEFRLQLVELFPSHKAS